jgi:peptide/nickel transport system ATP-binding protein
MSNPLLLIEDLALTVPHGSGERRILDGVTLALYPGEVVGLVGESGSGKSLTALAVLGLLPRVAKVRAGRIEFDGRNLRALAGREWHSVRGSQIAMIFQNPRAALNPLMRAGHQVARVVQRHRGLSKDAAYKQALELLQRVGIPDAGTRARAYPHQLSGGMAQRLLIAMMLACQPRLLIADEPTTGLDVTIQAQIFALIKDVQAETGATLLLITHDLGVVSEVCQRVAVMYAGQIMEVAPTEELFTRPKHPYTQMLMNSILRVDRPIALEPAQEMTAITITYDTSGCRFANRCPHVFATCRERRPLPVMLGDGHSAACHLYTNIESELGGLTNPPLQNPHLHR